MDDYISRQALCEYTLNQKNKSITPNDIMRFPSADIICPVRCGECKYVTKWRDEESARKFGQIYECMRGVFSCPKFDDFCSRGERKES